MIISHQTKLKDIISDNRLLEGVLYRFGFKRSPDYTIEEASIYNKKNPDFVIAILKAFDENSPFPKKELAAASISSLLEYLRKTHEFYLSKKLPEIEQSVNNLLRNYSDSDQAPISMSRFFMNYKKALTKHIKDEEEYLFPYIEYLLKLKQHGARLIKPDERLKNYSIADFILTHEEVEKKLIEIKEIIIKHSPALSASLPYRIFLIQMDIFEKDLIRHGLVEDEVLVPKALWLERTFLNSSEN